MGAAPIKFHVLRYYASGLAVAALIAGCATGHCRGKHPANEKHVFVYKTDGSRQCSKAAGISPEEMSHELTGIEIFSQESKTDGKMHVMMCGALKGNINVFEIGISDLEKAQKLGFQQLNPPPKQ